MNNKKLFKGALVLFASILMAVSCSNKDNTGPNDPNNPNNPNNPGTQKEKLAITLKTAENDGSEQSKAIMYTLKAENQAASPLPKIEFEGSDSKVIKVDGPEGIVASIVEVKGLKVDAIKALPTSLASKTKKALDETLTKPEEVTIAATTSSADNKLTLDLEAKTALKAVSDKIADTEGVGMATVKIKFEDKSGKKDPVELTVYVTFNRTA